MTELFNRNYVGKYHEYPIQAMESSLDGEFKRYMSFPTPKEVFDFAMMGLPRFLPLTNQMITPDLIKTYLASAVNQIESDLSCCLSETDFFQPEDHIADMFSSNYLGIKLTKWPATEVISVSMKFPHANTNTPYMSYTIPPQWVYLEKNKLNIVASSGSVSMSINNTASASSGGIFSYVSGFSAGMYQPGLIEVVYKAGFNHDKIPALVHDLIRVWAGKAFLEDNAPVLFPNSQVSVSVDGISQSVTYNIQQMLTTKIQMMDKRRTELSNMFKKMFGKTAKFSFIGA